MKEYDYKWKPKDYFLESETISNKFCIGFEEYFMNILGANFMRNYDILFDSKNTQVTFVRANCSNDPNFNSYYGDNSHSKPINKRDYFIIPSLTSTLSFVLISFIITLMLIGVYFFIKNKRK